MYGVVSYGCATTAGDGTEQLWNALQNGPPTVGETALRFQNRGRGSDLEVLTRKLSLSFREMMGRAPPGAAKRLLTGRYGVILASTKGCANDFIWNPPPKQLQEDPLTPLLNVTVQALELQPTRAVAISNACSSALAAARLAQIWLQQDLSDVIVLSADAVSDFVSKGFAALKLLSDQAPRPFSVDRNGFVLGEAAACLWLSHSVQNAKAILHPVGLDSEGSAVTRPTASGASLMRAAQQIPALKQRGPDLVIAHGTGTQINDQTEDLAFAQLFTHSPPFITGSKWCVGHTLAASGAIDMILAAEIVQRGCAFNLNTTTAIDPGFKGRYLTRDCDYGTTCARPTRIMVSSLGFGGMHASALLEVAP